MKHQHLRNNMHTSTLALSVVALILFFLPGCGKGEIPGEEGNETITLEVSASPIHFAAEGGMSEITVTTNAKSWNVTSSKTWCTVSKGASHFTVTATENKAFAPPENAMLTVTAEGTTKKVTIEVTQGAAVEPNETITLEVSASPIHFAFEGGMSEITVTTNAKSWNVTSSKSWCRVLSKEASNFTVGAAENKAITPPEQALLTVTAEGTTKKVTIEVTQDAAPKEAYIRPRTDKVIMNYQGGFNGIGIKTNITGWSCRSDQSWCRTEKISDEGITIIIDKSWSGTTPRKALVTLYGSEGDSLASIKVYQDPLPKLSLFSPVGNTNIPLPSYGGTIVVTVMTNVTEFTLGYVGEWLQVNKINDTQFTITSTPNNSTQMRPGQEIIVYASTRTQKLWVFEEEAEEASDNDDYDYSDPTGWD